MHIYEIAQSAGFIEYTLCISAVGKISPTPPMSILDMILSYLIVRCRVPLHMHYSQAH